MIGLHLLIIVCALIAMILAAFSVSVPRINWMCLSFAFLILSMLVH